ncbi:MAG: hypothetical protein ACR2NY_06060 [Alphaproteobacteria bacterium]
MLPIYLPHRACLSLSLKDSAKPDVMFAFLEKIITADTQPLIQRQPIYSALLTPNGKYIADFFMIACDGEWLIETDDHLATNLMAQLQKYILRQPIIIKPNDKKTYITFFEPDDDVFFMRDPRLYNHDDKICYRIYGDLKQYEKNQTAYHQWRIDHLLPEGLMDFTINDSLIIEYHFHNIGGLSLQKGCFIGQEVTARMFYKNAAGQKLKKHLIKKIIDENNPAHSNDKILSSIMINHQTHALVLEKTL